MANRTAHANPIDAALAVLEEPLPRPASFVAYHVRRCLLLLGPTRPTLKLAEKLRHQFDVVAVITDARPETRLMGVRVVSAPRVSLAGHLGRFSAQAQDHNGESVDLAAQSTNADGFFDLVMDLSPTPILDQEILPLGYLRPTDPRGYEAAIAELPGLTGEVHKPKYFNFDPSRCVHRRQQVPGCDRCLAVCPTAAISSGPQTIQVDAHLCRGCGTCTVVCPTAALTYANPTVNDIVNRLERALRAFRSAGGLNPWVGFYADAREPVMQWAGERNITLLPFEVPSVPSLGLEIWLAAIGFGAAGVLLSVSENTPNIAVSALTQQVDLTKKILEGLGHSPTRVRLLHGDAADRDSGAVTQASNPVSGQASPYPKTDPDPRARLLDWFDRLWHESHQPTRNPVITLPRWATFGTLELDTSICTMCLACTGLCPTEALRADPDGAELSLVEAACVQCGLCEQGCPEDAIKRQPRLSYQALKDRGTITLNRTEKAICARCGQPFMSTTLLTAALEHLSGDSAAHRQAKQMLKTCPNCRADKTLIAQLPPIPR